MTVLIRYDPHLLLFVRGSIEPGSKVEKYSFTAELGYRAAQR